MQDRNFYPEDFLDHEVARFVDEEPLARAEGLELARLLSIGVVDEPCKEIDRRPLPTDHDAWPAPDKWRMQSWGPAKDADVRRKAKRRLAKKARRNNRR